MKPKGWLPTMIVILGMSKAEGQYLGSFKQLTYHPVAGDLTVRDDQTFTIRNFVYDGEGPDVFFIVGLRNARSRPNPRDAIPVPYPTTQAFPYGNGPAEPRNSPVSTYRFEDPDIPILGRFDGQDIDLQLPQGIGVHDVKWISLYCRQFGIDFGHVKIRNPKSPPRSRKLRLPSNHKQNKGFFSLLQRLPKRS